MTEYDLKEQQTIEDLRMITRKLCNNPKESLFVKVGVLLNKLRFGDVDLTKERVQSIIDWLRIIQSNCKE